MYQKTKQILLQVLPVAIIATFLVVAIIYAWTEPTNNPPEGNVPAPINVSGSAQTFLDSKTLKVKDGDGILTLEGGLNVIGIGIFEGNVGIGKTTALEKLDIAGDLRLPNFRTRTMTRLLPLRVNDTVDIGSFTFTNGGGTLWISVTVPSNGYSVAKQYLLPIQYNQQSNTWTTALPISDSGEYRGNDFALDVKVRYNVAALRLRTTATDGLNRGTAYIVIKQEGINTDIFRPSSARASNVTAPTILTEGTVLTQVNGNVGIGTAAPSQKLDVEGYVKGRSGLCIGNDCKTEWPGGPGGGSIEIIAVHSQSTSVPACPSGWEELWNGYSLAASFLSGGFEAFNDLGSSGSCVEEFRPIAVIECGTANNPYSCNFYTGGDFSMWLTSDNATTDTGEIGEPSGKIEDILPYISRCAVCKKSTKLVVRHSFSEKVPSCPTNSTELWRGYSLHGAYLGPGFNSSQDLKSPGSCLKKFRPMPVIECGTARNPYSCNFYTPGDFSMWLTTATTNTGEIGGIKNILPYISRCVVCEY